MTGALESESGVTHERYIFTKFIGCIVYFNAFSFQSPELTDSKNQSPALRESLLVNGQYGWNGASSVSI